MSAPVFCGVADLPEGWVDGVALDLWRRGWAFRAGAGSAIEVQSDTRGWMPLNLPTNAEHFDSKRTRDCVLALIEDGVRSAGRLAYETRGKVGADV